MKIWDVLKKENKGKVFEYNGIRYKVDKNIFGQIMLFKLKNNNSLDLAINPVLTDCMEMNFELIQEIIKGEIVSIIEVLNSNKKCMVEHEYINKINFSDFNIKMLKEYNDFCDILFILIDNLEDIKVKEVIKKGKWYLEE